MITTSRESVFILLKVIKRHEEKRLEGRTELAKLKTMSFDGQNIKSSDTVELLGITLDKKINFKRHTQNIYRKASNKIKALLRIRKFLNLEKAQVLAKACISSSFRYCPLIWMFCGKMSDNLIVNTHYRTLRAIYDTQRGSYDELLHLSGTKKSHKQILQILMAEVYKYLNNINALFTWDYFKQKKYSISFKEYATT